ncbi:MAG: hypothetical protein C5B49_01915 [Bdellovibrio sp.]|nr:MAG: hypothetical protein C5B49_01915 [Bdellovibrio sp.]
MVSQTVFRYITNKRGETFEILIDAEDAPFFDAHKWKIHKRPNCNYVLHRRLGYFHRLILGITDKSLQTDHINHNGLDNRRQNLRAVTVTQNKYKGVTWRRDTKRWQAQIGVNQKHFYLGCFGTEEEAARAYDRVAQVFFGEHAHKNFPGEIKWELI